jgi:hypothetical protein
MSNPTLQCPRCGTNNSITARFCQNCAQPLKASGSQPHFQASSSAPINQTASPPQQPTQAAGTANTKRGCLNPISATFLAAIILVSMCGIIAQIAGLDSSRSNRTNLTQSASKTSASKPAQPEVRQATTQKAPSNAPAVPTSAPESVPAGTGPTYNEVCNLDESSVTEIQLQAHADSFAGQSFTNWQAYVYDVEERDGQYIVELADDRSGLFWARDIEVRGVPAEIAVPLRVEQPVLLSGRIAQVDVSFGSLCNPVIVDTATLVPSETGGAPIPTFPTGELTYAAVCGIDESKVTEVQLAQYARQFGGHTFSNWQGYVYDVQERNGQYNLQLADSKRGFIWARTMEVNGIPAELAIQLNVEQPVLVSGRIVAVEVGFGVICNPIIIDNATITIQ